MAVAHATYILKTSEQLMEDEHPDTWKWAFSEEMEVHFERIKKKRDAKYGNKRSDDDDEPANGWQQNEYARNLR